MIEIEKQHIDAMLEELDDAAIARGEPPLSCIVRHDDGTASTAFIRTVAKHNLRLPNETDAQVAERYAELAFKHYRTTTEH